MGLKARYKKNAEESVKEEVLVEEVQAEEVQVEVEKVEETEKTSSVKTYPRKIDKVYAKLSSGGVFFEILEDGFNLSKKDKGYNTKVHFNFIQLNKSDAQIAFLSHYLDLTNFLYLRNLFLTGEYISLEEKERSTLSASKKYCEPIFSEFKKPTQGPSTSSTFYISPGMTQGKWMIGVVRVENGKSTRIQVPVETERLIGMFELIYLAYQRDLFLKN